MLDSTCHAAWADLGRNWYLPVGLSSLIRRTPIEVWGLPVVVFCSARLLSPLGFLFIVCLLQVAFGGGAEPDSPSVAERDCCFLDADAVALVIGLLFGESFFLKRLFCTLALTAKPPLLDGGRRLRGCGVRTGGCLDDDEVCVEAGCRAFLWLWRNCCLSCISHCQKPCSISQNDLFVIGTPNGTFSTS